MKLLTQGEVERMIVALSGELEDTTYEYAQLSDLAVNAECAYKAKSARLLVTLAADPALKLTAGEKQARVDVNCQDEYHVWKLAEAQRQSCREALLSLRARLDATRTLSANLRHQT